MSCACKTNEKGEYDSEKTCLCGAEPQPPQEVFIDDDLRRKDQMDDWYRP